MITYMILILIYVIFFIPVSLSLIPIILQTPIFSNNKILNIHHSVGLYKNKQDNTYKHMYIVDFGPNIPIDNPQNIGKLLLGNHVNGKIRVFYFDTMNHNYLLDNFNDIVNTSTNRIILTKEFKRETEFEERSFCTNSPERSGGELCDCNILDGDFFTYSKELQMILEPTNNWDLNFHLYTHNCQHFSKYFIHQANNFMESS